MDGSALQDQVAIVLVSAYGRLARLKAWEGNDRGKKLAVKAFVKRLESAYAARQQANWTLALERLLDAKKVLIDLAPEAPD